MRILEEGETQTCYREKERKRKQKNHKGSYISQAINPELYFIMDQDELSYYLYIWRIKITLGNYEITYIASLIK